MSLLLAGLGAVAAALATVVALRGIALGSVPADRLMSYCRRFLLPQLTPGGAVTLGLGVLGASVMMLAVRSALHQVRQARRFVSDLATVGELDAGEVTVVVVGGMVPAAFCAGVLRPRIYLSVGALDALSPAERKAVIAHEAHHVRRRDPLRILLVRTLSDALFFLPALRRLRRRYEELAELAADEAAVRVTGDPSPLARALLEFGRRDAPGVVVGIAPERVDHLLGEEPRWKLPLSLSLSAAITVAVLVALALASLYATGDSSVNLVVLAARSCMVAMTVTPIIALGGAAVLAQRAARLRRR